jgi:tetratricopeptide (TPR) repeat protein
MANVEEQRDTIKADATIAEIDRAIIELGHAIALNSDNAVAYRDRGRQYGRRGDYERAISDLTAALTLAPNDAEAYYFRGTCWRLKRERQKALADFDRAIEIDPANADVYRAGRQKVLEITAKSDKTAGPGSAQTHAQSAPLSGTRLSGFFKKLAQYYAEFLATDFKKQSLPRRRLEDSDAKGHLVGIPLRKYPGFQQKLWVDLAKPIGTGLSLVVSRGSWRATLPRAVVEAISTHIATVSQKDLDDVVGSVMTQVDKLAEHKGGDPAIAFERFIEAVRASLARSVVAPLLARMDGFFERTAHKPVESLRELEDQLSARLIYGIESASGAVFSQLLVERKAGPLEALLRDQLDAKVVCAQLEAFFATFSAGDLYVELSDLVRSSRLIENVDFYLHIGEVKHSGHVFPMFYIPFSAERTEQGFKINSEPRLYVNKRAMDYVAQDVAKAEGRGTVASMLRDRIFYLQPHESPLRFVQDCFEEMAGGFNLGAAIDFREPREQKVGSAHVSATNSLSFSLFDRSDESMVNDYEALLTGIEAGSDVTVFFTNLINEFLLNNPIPVRADVNQEWDETPMPQRLVFDSPLPLVEEQRKIISAIKHPDARFIAVEGPPGTGKSHTITAVAFDLILSGKSLLVLSDKKEALDVVEDKLNQALAKVRPSDDFINPILRLGKDASNYGQLLKKNVIERLEVNQRVLRKGKAERAAALRDERMNLMAGLQETANAYAAIDVSEIAHLEADVADLIRRRPEVAKVLADDRLSSLTDDFGAVATHLRSREALARILTDQGRSPSRLNELARVATALASCVVDASEVGSALSFSLERLRALEGAIDEIEDLRVPVFGYVFAGKKLLKVARLLRDECRIESETPHRDLPRLKKLRNSLKQVRESLARAGLEAEFESGILLIAAKLAGADQPILAPAAVLDAANRLDVAMSLGTPLLAPGEGQFYRAMLMASAGPLAPVSELAELKAREEPIRARFAAVPKIDYVGAKARIENLNTQALAEHIDERFIEFYDHNKNHALQLRDIIKGKKRFPLERFADLKRAFPCIIAGLRDYAEFIPLEREIFDLVIIDEASQVSIAQALPAIIRAKKVLVLGDRNQFGNVKTSNASREVNVAYMRDLIQSFVEDFSDVDDAVMTKVDRFDIRSSVLDFIEPIANFDIQLKKHFRSYPEMISFSSKYFYGDSLQVMKIRGKAIDEVIEFDAIEHDGLMDKQRNVNILEAKRIVERIEEALAYDPLPSVGVITPHTEQQAYIAKLVGEHSRSEEFYDKLRLKIMTFDTCQGEEREIVFYSLVATDQKDRLAYVFPRELRKNAEEVDHNLRLQRLNVGLSRGQEKIVFVHSKPLEKYGSALRVALQHYDRELERAKCMPTEDDVDPASPMERQVLHWLHQVPLIRDYDGDCEVLANFELGQYLRQLDQSYRHPDYRVDFLIRIADRGRQHQLVLEYDGFEFHFQRGIPTGSINTATWRSYLTEHDLEREKVLESFGFPMVRLNRFNLGRDPVATIDGLLRERLDAMLNGEERHDLVKKAAETANQIEAGLKTGEYKRCRKCDRDLAIDMFRDDHTKTGFGRLCRDCKSTKAPNYRAPRFRRR